jgi:hypothetical protein
MTSTAPAGRPETEIERLERNWAEILQELRVMQTGTQIITGFLLAMVFQQRFTTLTPFEITVYLTLVILSILAAVLALTPVALHRALFRRHEKVFLVHAAQRVLRIALVVVGITLSGIALLIFDAVVSLEAGWIAAGLVFLGCGVAWAILPFAARMQPDEPDPTRPA